MAKRKKQKSQKPQTSKKPKGKSKGNEKSPPKKKNLTEKQRRFVEAYMGEAAGNAVEAARRAGYKGNANTLHSVGVENLRKPTIRAAIDERVESDPAVATRKDRQQFWTKTMDSADVEMHNRLRASELLGKSQADFVDRKEIDVNISWMNVVKIAKAALLEQDDGES